MSGPPEETLKKKIQPKLRGYRFSIGLRHILHGKKGAQIFCEVGGRGLFFFFCFVLFFQNF